MGLQLPGGSGHVGHSGRIAQGGSPPHRPSLDASFRDFGVLGALGTAPKSPAGIGPGLARLPRPSL